jgi:uncharacterized protein YjbI with pentapeptide repeats
MANPEHVELVWKGAKHVNEWRKKHPKEILDLSEADLRLVNLYGANLSNCNLERAMLSFAYLMDADLRRANLKCAALVGATLSRVDLSEADLSKSDLTGADLSSANLSKSVFKEATLDFSFLGRANLSEADFSKASLFDTNLSYADLSLTNFSGADLSITEIVTDKLGADFSGVNLLGATLRYLDFSKVKIAGAIMGYTVLADCVLVGGVGLETIKHDGPSNIDFWTLLNSFRMAGGKFPADVELFLLNAGIPKHLLDVFPDIVANIEYCRCFICYGAPDTEFAEKLVDDLRKLGVSCWLYSMDSTPGERTWSEITKKRREADKMIVLCSDKSLIRDGVLKEIEEQIDENPEKIVPISLDNIWKEKGFHVKRGERDLKTFLIERNYADFSDKSKYQGSLQKLLKALKRKSQTPT